MSDNRLVNNHSRSKHSDVPSGEFVDANLEAQNVLLRDCTLTGSNTIRISCFSFEGLRPITPIWYSIAAS